MVRLELRWEVVSNHFEGDTFRASLTITNRGDVRLPGSGWSIYFNSCRKSLPESVTGGIAIEHVNGDLYRLVPAVVTVANEVKRDDGVVVTLGFRGGPRDFMVLGHDSRLSQVINNLIDNARSFSPPDGKVRVTCARSGTNIMVTVDDDGPGIRPDAIEKIFERFYTDRPQQNFGQNSGLGLSISKQIVDAHGGCLTAENRLAAVAGTDDGAAKVLGARFSVHLPAM